MKSVVICGSSRFKPEIREFAKVLKKRNVVVFEPYLHQGNDEWEKLSGEYQDFVLLGLTHDHFYKIKMADVVYIFNKNGYSGVSTTLELGYAVALGKIVYAFSKDIDEGCRNILFREIIKDPEALTKKLE